MYIGEHNIHTMETVSQKKAENISGWGWFDYQETPFLY